MYRLLDAGPSARYRLTQVKPIPEQMIRVRAFDGNGNPLSAIAVALHYPTEPELLRLESQRLKTSWQTTAFFDYTDKNGVVEFPFDLHQGSPYTIWVLSVTYHSDGATDITRGMELFFRLAHEQESQAEKTETPVRLRSVLETVLGILEDKEQSQGMGVEHAVILLRSALEIAAKD